MPEPSVLIIRPPHNAKKYWEAGGGNLHRGRGATAWGREDGGDDATEAGGGKKNARRQVHFMNKLRHSEAESLEDQNSILKSANGTSTRFKMIRKK